MRHENDPSKKYQLADLEGGELAELPVERQEGRRVWIAGQPEGRREKVDFCSTNYLGLDQSPELVEEGIRLTREWGVISNWSRFELDPAIYPECEKAIEELIGTGGVILAHTITAAGFSLIPHIVGRGTVLVDAKLHTVVWEAVRLARDHGAKVVKFAHQDVGDLETKLADLPKDEPKLVCVDGVYSISAERAPIAGLQRLCRDYGAFLYVDDAHGFGVTGPRGAGVVSEAGGDYGRTFYVSSFNKAFCTHTAFSTQPPEFAEKLRSRHLQHLFSAPISPFTVGTVMAAIRINRERGDALRARLSELSLRLRRGFKAEGFDVDDRNPHPVVFLKIGSLEDFQAFAAQAFRNGVVAGIRTFPVVPRDGCGLRFAVSAAHTEADVDLAVRACADAARAAFPARKKAA